jgi:hypothetical protein
LISEVLPERCDIPPGWAWMSSALRDLHVLFEDASFIALYSPAAALGGEHRFCLRTSAAFEAGQAEPKSTPIPTLLASTPLLGFSKDCPFIDISQRASTPGSFWLDASIPPFATFDLELPPPGSFRPCRSSRLRRFPPLVRRRLVASCSRSWGSLRFYILIPETS